MKEKMIVLGDLPKKDGYFHLYKITNLGDQTLPQEERINKVYLGQTNNPFHRLEQYESGFKRGNDESVIDRALQKYGNKYGLNNFTFEIIAVCKTREDCNYIEKELITQHDSRNSEKGYNIATGGLCIEMTSDIREKIGKGRRAHYKEYGNPRKGVALTEEHKQAISEGSMGKPGTNSGKKFSEEHKRKISESNMGKTYTPEQIKRMSDSHIGQIAVNKKLTNEQAEEIRLKYKNKTHTKAQLGRDYSLSFTSITDIINEKTYKIKEGK